MGLSRSFWAWDLCLLQDSLCSRPSLPCGHVWGPLMAQDDGVWVGESCIPSLPVPSLAHTGCVGVAFNSPFSKLCN